MNTQETSGTPRGNTPPYVSYPSFKTLFSEFHDHDIPTRIDRSVLTRFSGVIGTQLLTSLRFLKLINEKSEPTERLRTLAAAYGTPDWAKTLLAILRTEYAPIFELDLAAATSSHFMETFRRTFPASTSDAVSQKCVAFFLGAARDSGIAISERVLKGRKPRATNGSQPRRVRKAAAPASAPSVAPAPVSPGTGISAPLNLDELLIQLLRRIPSKEDGWPQEQRVRWFRAFAINVSEVFDDPKEPVDLTIQLAAADGKKTSAP